MAEVDKRASESTPAEEPNRDRWRGKLLKRTALIWVGVFALFNLWSFATPLWMSPDANVHEAMAYHSVREMGIEPTDVEANGVTSNTNTPIPQGVAESGWSIGCIIHQPEHNATCIQPINPELDEKIDFANSAGRNIPTYYLITGWPSLFVDVQYFPYADRAAGAAVAALMVAWAATAAMTRRRPGVALLGVIVPMTPMVTFLGGAVNPNALEITAALALAATSVAFLLEGPDTWLGRVMFRRAMIAVAIMCSIRMLAPVWALVWALAFVVLATRKHWAHIFSRAGIGWFLLPVFACVVNVAWTLYSGVSDIQAVPKHAYPFFDALKIVTDFQQSAMLTQMIGNFGWLDTPLPPGDVYRYGLAALFVIFAVILRLRQREIALLLALALIQHYLPILMETLQLNDNGLVWQGRYTLPITLLVPVFALMLASERLPRPGTGGAAEASTTRAIAWMFPVATFFMLLVHFRGFLQVLRRYVSGVTGEGLFDPSGWQPPLPVEVLIAGHTALLLAVLVSITWYLRRDVVATAVPSPSPTTPEALATGATNER